jgi:lysophospholipase L1-like esterase
MPVSMGYMRARIVPPLAAFLLLAALVLGQRPAHAQESTLYIALGDSLAFGVGAGSPEQQGYVALTTARLSESGAVQLRNLSVPGATSADLLQPNGQVDLAVDALEGQSGSVIISVDVGANDLLALAANGSPCLDDPGGQPCQTALGDTLATLQSNLTQSLHRLRDASPGARIFVIDLYNPYSGIGGDRELIASVGVQQVNGVITASARDPSVDVTFVSIHDVFEGRAHQWIASDGIHPNNDGYRVMAEGLIAAIEGRPAVLPSDLAQPPSATTAPAQQVKEDDGGVDTLIPAIGIPAAFVAGLVLSAAFFLVQGKR